MIRSQPIGRRYNVESVVGQSFFKLRFERRGPVDQEIAEPLLGGKSANEILLANDKFALENAVVERANQPELRAIDVDHVADLFVQNVDDRVRIGDRGNRAVLRRSVER